MQMLREAAAIASLVHSFAQVGLDTIPPNAVDLRTTITIPAVEDPATRAAYGWVMAEGTQRNMGSFTQIGYAWWPDRGPVLFAYTADDQNVNALNGSWSFGPYLYPGEKISVQVALVNGEFADQYYTPQGWVTLTTDYIAGPILFTTFEEAYGKPQVACFSNRGWLGANGVWHTEEGGCA